MSRRSDRPKRRSFTAQHRADIFAEYDAADSAARDVPLRREGMYSSHLSEWRKPATAVPWPALGPILRERVLTCVTVQAFNRLTFDRAGVVAKRLFGFRGRTDVNDRFGMPGWVARVARAGSYD